MFTAATWPFKRGSCRMNMPYSRLCEGSMRPWLVETLLSFSSLQVEEYSNRPRSLPRPLPSAGFFSCSQVEEYSNTCNCNALELNGIHFQLCGPAVQLEEETHGRSACSGCGVSQVDNSGPRLQTENPDQQPDPFSGSRQFFHLRGGAVGGKLSRSDDADDEGESEQPLQSSPECEAQ